MAITTLDGIITGMRPPEAFVKSGTTTEAAGVLHSHLYAPGLPGAAVAPTPGLNGAALTTYAGQLPFTNPGSGNTYLARLQGTTSSAGTLILADRLWHNSALVVTTTGAQALTSVAWPARDRDGSTNGENIQVAIEVSTATTNAGAITTITMSYTNQAGTAGKTGTIPTFPATAVAGTFVAFNLAAGDTGVRSVQSVTLGTTLGAGTIHLVAFRVIAQLELSTANLAEAIDAITSGFPRMYDNTVPWLLWLPTAAAAANIMGQMIVTQG